MIKPAKLKPGDYVAAVSPSWGGAGDLEFKWRFDQGVNRLEEVFGLKVVPMPNSLSGTEYLYNHPEARAEDLMTAFRDKRIKAIFANIGGDDSIRLLPHIDFEVIRNNPKIFVGYSDITIAHLFCYKAGVSSFYGPAILTDFAENVEMDPYTIKMVKRTLFSGEEIGEIAPAKAWTSERLEWAEGLKKERRTMNPNYGFELLQGKGTVHGRLIGGCMDVLEFAKGTDIWPAMEAWEESLLFFETSEEQPNPDYVTYWLRNYAAQGILQKAKGILFGKPYQETYYHEYKEAIMKVLGEYNLQNLPVLYNLNFGHTEPKFILPYGARAEIDCAQQTFSIVESGVL